MNVWHSGSFIYANRKLLSKVREILGCKKLETKKKAKPIKTFKCKDCKKEMIVVLLMPRYAVINNKAPPSGEEELLKSRLLLELYIQLLSAKKIRGEVEKLVGVGMN